MAKTEDLTVTIANREGTCAECSIEIESGTMITRKLPQDVFCLTCSDLDHLVYLPSGNTALTRRARKYSTLSAVVMKFSKSRRRNERQGVLVTTEGLVHAEEECLSDEDQRAKRRERDQVRTEKKDGKYIQEFAAEICRLFPGCPDKTASDIANHACEKYSGRVGRTSGAKELEESYVTLAVRAHIRHTETNYDELLSKSYDREWAREQIRDKIEDVVILWQERSIVIN